ncbi:MAG: hypothetical protein LBN95_08125 [Prevotellaceae bacterium]|jgi:hypothetical protein|nr:hypothetical protein [Prevotellaceae bacterium]
MKDLNKKLTINYYAVYFAAVILAVLGYFLKENNLIIENAKIIEIIRYVFILYILISIPLTLKFFSVQVKKIAKIENETLKIAKYLQVSIIRIWLIATNLLLGILFVYVLYQPDNRFDMLYFAAIGAVALFFCRPTKQKTETDLK